MGRGHGAERGCSRLRQQQRKGSPAQCGPPSPTVSHTARFWAVGVIGPCAHRGGPPPGLTWAEEKGAPVRTRGHCVSARDHRSGRTPWLPVPCLLLATLCRVAPFQQRGLSFCRPSGPRAAASRQASPGCIGAHGGARGGARGGAQNLGPEALSWRAWPSQAPPRAANWWGCCCHGLPALLPVTERWLTFADGPHHGEGKGFPAPWTACEQ